jgi:hypothetical protein
MLKILGSGKGYALKVYKFPTVDPWCSEHLVSDVFGETSRKTVLNCYLAFKVK